MIQLTLNINQFIPCDISIEDLNTYLILFVEPSDICYSLKTCE